MKRYPSNRDVLCQQTLENAGYRRYNQSLHQCDWMWQKRIKDGNNTLYWIHVFVYDFTKYRMDAGVGYTAEVGMHVASVEGFEPRSICVIVNDFMSLSELECYAKELYNKLGGVIDPHN